MPCNSQKKKNQLRCTSKSLCTRGQSCLQSFRRPILATLFKLFKLLSLNIISEILKSTNLATTDDTFILIVAKRALVTYSHERRRSNVAVANGTFAVALVAESTDGDAGLFAAHDQIAVR